MLYRAAELRVEGLVRQALTSRAVLVKASELRRFPDGKINEAVVWEGVPPGERHRIPDLAVQYILLRHLPHGFGVYEGAGNDKVPRVLEPIEVMVQLEGSGRMPSDHAAFAKMKAALGVQLAAALAAACGAKVTATEEALEVLWQGFAFKLLLYLDRDNPVLAALAGLPGSEAAIAKITAAAAGGPVPRPVVLSRHHGLVSALEAAHAAYGPTVRLAKRWLGLQLLLGSQVSEEAVELLVGAAFSGPSCRRTPASRVSGFLRFLHLVASHPWQAAPLMVDPAGEVKPAARRALLARFEGLRAAGACPGMFLATPFDLQSSTWTSHKQPGPLETHHLVTLARSALQQLSLLVVLGPDAPAVQQLVLLSQERDRKGHSKGHKRGTPDASVTGASSAAGVNQQQQQRHLVKLEMAALAKAWRQASGAALGGFDVWFVLRKEALPFPGRVLASKHIEKLQGELLVGFNPISQLLHLCNERYGAVASFCADPVGCFPAIALKWHPQAFIPSILQPGHAHGLMELGVTTLTGPARESSANKFKKKKTSGPHFGLVVPNVPQVLAEVCEMGLGLIEQVVLLTAY
eukprot:gene10181-10341_t